MKGTNEDNSYNQMKEPMLKDQYKGDFIDDKIQNSNNKTSNSIISNSKNDENKDINNDSGEYHNKIKVFRFIRKSYFKIFFYIFMNIITAGIINLVIAWFKNLYLVFIYSVTDNCDNAEKIYIIGNDDQITICDINKFKIDDSFNEGKLINHLKRNILDINIKYEEIVCTKNNNFQEIKIFEYRLYTYFIDKNHNIIAIKFDLNPLDKKLLLKELSGLNNSDIEFLKFLYGPCNLLIPLNNVLTLIWLEVQDPFYLFQLYSIILWYNNSYASYATVILITSILSLTFSVYETRQNFLNIQKMAKYSIKVKIVRDKKLVEIDSENLVPGDILIVPEISEILPCDGLLIKGNVLLNESLLTGESTPVLKDPINPNGLYDNETEKRHYLYSGTKVISKRGECIALVLQTGYNTQKGSLIRSILFPKPIKNKFQSESVKYIILMGIVGILGYCISIPFMLGVVAPYQIVVKFFDLFTTVVPPGLPACLGIGISYAVSRLKSHDINCIDRRKVNIAGTTNLICFDKTGTLTEDHLDIVGFKRCVIGSKGFEFETLKKDFSSLAKLNFNDIKESLINKNSSNIENVNFMDRMFIESLASCHTLSLVNTELLGDPIDVAMFQKSNWKLIEEVTENNNTNDVSEENKEKPFYECGDFNKEISITVSLMYKDEQSLNSKIMELSNKNNVNNNSNENNNESNNNDDNIEELEDNIVKSHYELSVVRKFNFSSHMQRMTVITKMINELDTFYIYTKGSPEKVSSLCKPETIPTNFNAILNHYTSKGFRVMAISGRKVKCSFLGIQTMQRSNLESNMVFLGLIIIQNKLKKMTIPTINLLNNCKLKMVMATGDNMNTAVAVSRECGLINSDAQVYYCNIYDQQTDQEGSGTNLQKNNISVNHKYKLEWELIEDNNVLLEGDINTNRISYLNTVNSSLVNIRDNNETIYKDGRITFEKKFDSLKDEKMIDFEKIKQFYCYLKEDDLSNHINNEYSNAEDILNENFEKQRDKTINRTHSNSFKSQIDINFENHLDIKKENNIIVTNGRTLELLIKFIKNSNEDNSEIIELYKETLRLILKKGIIFSRMSPDNKTMLVECFQNENFTVCMCGDGANDCGALKAANVGMSLSMEEASIAAPFTSKVGDISSLVNLLLESKASIVTSFQCFKFMMFYSVIQFLSVILMNVIGSYVTDNQFLMSDVFIIFPIALLIARTETSEKLNKYLPISSLFNPSILSSLILQSAVFFAFQYGIWLILISQKSFKPDTCKFDEKDAPIPCTENTAIYLISNFQYITASVVIGFTKYFKKQIYTNFYLIGFIIITFGLSFFSVLQRTWFSDKIMNVSYFYHSNRLFNLMIMSLIT